MLSLSEDVETVAENDIIGSTLDVKMLEGMKIPRASNRALVGMDIEFDGYGMVFVKARSIRPVNERVWEANCLRLDGLEVVGLALRR